MTRMTSPRSTLAGSASIGSRKRARPSGSRNARAWRRSGPSPSERVNAFRRPGFIPSRRITCSVIRNTAPLADLLGQRADIPPADLIQVGGQRVAAGSEKARIRRIRVGAAQELDLEQIMCRHHPRVGGLKLIVQPLRAQEIMDRADPVRDHQTWPLVAL